jgi:hypothetical protein
MLALAIRFVVHFAARLVPVKLADEPPDSSADESGSMVRDARSTGENAKAR